MEGGRRGIGHDWNLYLGRKFLGTTPDIFADYVKFSMSP